MFDILSDILSALGKNKLRTVLTGLSMAWGIFMLVALLGCGNGLMNAMLLNFSDRSTNVASIFPGRSSKPYAGLQSGRRSIIDDDILDGLKKQMPQIGRIAPTRMVWGVVESYGGEYTSGGGLYGITPEYCELSDFNIVAGRGINRPDHDGRRKVVVMHRSNVDVLFKGKDPLGEWVTVNNVPYQVIGIYDSSHHGQNEPDVIPLSTMMKVYATARGYGRVMLEVNGITDKQSSEEFEKNLRRVLASELRFDPTDESAVWIWNQAGDYLETMSIFSGIRLFLWLITIGTLIAGVVGISNIMLVTVRERTKEFGIRKSLGARPSSIMAMILSESLLITLGFGYLGLLAGILLLEGLCKIFPRPESFDMEHISAFVEPYIDFNVALAALGILVAAGLLAAYIPAKKAVMIKPVEAMHYE